MKVIQNPHQLSEQTKPMIEKVKNKNVKIADQFLKMRIIHE